MICISDVLPVILYTLGCILLITLIVLVIKINTTVNKINNVLDDFDNKSKKLNVFFEVVDSMADALSVVSDKAVALVVNGILSLFKRKEKKEEIDKDE